MNLTELTNKVTNILIDAPAAVTGEIHSELDAAQREAEDRYAFIVMEEVDSFLASFNDNGGPFGIPVASINKPSDWVRAWNINTPTYVDSVTDSTIMVEWAPSVRDMQINYSDTTETGSPQFLVESSELVTVWPVPDDDYDVSIPYIKRLDAPSSASSETWFMDAAWRYLVFKASSECLSLNRDHEESTLYALKAERELKRLMNQDKRSRFKGDTLPMQRDALAPFNQRLR